MAIWILAAAKLVVCWDTSGMERVLLCARVCKQLGSKKKWETGKRNSTAMRHRVATSTPSKWL